jgi:hypothetical protein
MGWYLSIVYTLLASHPLLVADSYIYVVLGLFVFLLLRDGFFVSVFFVHNFSLCDCDAYVCVLSVYGIICTFATQAISFVLTGVKSRANQSTLSPLCRLPLEGFS